MRIYIVLALTVMSSLAHTSFLKEAVLKDPTFSLSSGPASSCHDLAENLLSWIPGPPDASCTFGTELVRLLSSCLEKQHSNPRVRREKMWLVYHMLRVSDDKIDLFYCTGKSFVEMVYYPFTLPDVKSFFLSQRIC